MNCFRASSCCGQIRAAIGTLGAGTDTAAIAQHVRLPRNLVSRSLCRMARMGYVRREAPATIGRFAKAARWSLLRGS